MEDVRALDLDIVGHRRVRREDMWDALSRGWQEVQMPHTGGVVVDVLSPYLVMSFRSPHGQ